MRCDRALRQVCPDPDRCQITGCTAPHAGTAVARERDPIDLPPLDEYRPGGMMAALMRWQDAGPERARKRHRLLRPFASAPEALEAPAALSPPETPMDPIAPAASPEPRPASPPTPFELRIVEIEGGWLIYRNAVPSAVAADRAALGAKVAEMVARR